MRASRWWLVGLTLPLLGCPMESTEPLAPPSIELIDPALAGTWRCLGSDQDAPGRVEFRHRADGSYDVTVAEEPVDVNKIDHFTAHITRVRGRSILNVQEEAKDAKEGKEAKDPDWAFLLYTIYGRNVLELDTFEGGHVEPAIARRRIDEQLKSSKSQEPFLVCIRTHVSSEPQPTSGP